MPLWWLPEARYFPPKAAWAGPTETGIACNNLFPSYFEGNGIPWFDSAIPSPKLIAFSLMTDLFLYIAAVQMLQPWLYDAEVWQPWRLGGCQYPSSPNSLPPYQEDVTCWPGTESWQSPKSDPKCCLSYFPMNCCVSRPMETMHRWGRRGGWHVGSPQGAGYSGCTRGAMCLQTPLNTPVCSHDGFVLAKGCWHSDVFWRYNREASPEKWQR